MTKISPGIVGFLHKQISCLAVAYLRWSHKLYSLNFIGKFWYFYQKFDSEIEAGGLIAEKIKLWLKLPKSSIDTYPKAFWPF